MQNRTPIGVYKTDTGYAAYDKHGVTWKVSATEADDINVAKPTAK
ncbi:hypothetical protein ACRARG_12745 [Pseudooceanicola sp. C21-150M6]